MLKWARNRNTKGLLLALYALVAISLVFAQGSLRDEPAVNQIDLAAYALPGGELPSICAGKSHTEGTSQEHGCKACESCAASSNPQMAVQDTRVLLPVLRPTVVMAIPADAHVVSRRPANVRTRAPPSATLPTA